MTRARQAVLAALGAATEPLAAAGVLPFVGENCDKATVYRALDYLEKAGLVESFVLRCAEHGTERYFVSKDKPHRHWFHCEFCHRFIDLGACRIGNLTSELERDFVIRIRQHVLYFSGRCDACRGY